MKFYILSDADLFWNQRVATLSRSLHVKTLPQPGGYVSVLHANLPTIPLSHINQTNTASKQTNSLLQIT